MKHKLLSILTVLALVLSLCPVAAFAAEGDGTEANPWPCGAAGDNLTATLSGNTLTISGAGAMANYDAFENKSPWYDSSIDINTVVLPNGLTTIGSYAFSGTTLETVTIPNNVTEIGAQAFSLASKLTSVTIPANVTSVGAYAFQSCVSLETVTFLSETAPKIAVSYVGSFYNCNNLKTINVPHGCVGAYKTALEGTGVPSGASITAPDTPHNWREDGSCVCGAQAAAKMELNNATTYLTTAEELINAFAASGNDGAAFTLLDNITSSDKIDIYSETSYTLDLNGYTCALSGYNGAFVISGSLTVLDSKGGGGVTAEERCFDVGSGGQLIITGGTFHGGDSAVLLNDGTLQVFGGTLIGGQAIVSSTDPNLSLNNILADGCAASNQSGRLLARSVMIGSPGSITVAKCDRELQPSRNNDGTHTLECAYCGQKKDREDCIYGEKYSFVEDIHWQTCSVCGYQKKNAHTNEYTAEADGRVITVVKSCSTCGYEAELGTVTVTIPELVYGDLSGVISVDGLPMSILVTLKVDEYNAYQFNAQGDVTLGDLTNNTPLNAGEHTLRVAFIMKESGEEFEGCDLTFTVAPARLSVTDVVAKDRVYQPGNRTVAVTEVSGTIEDLPGFTYLLNGLTGTISGENAGTYNTVTLTEDITTADGNCIVPAGTYSADGVPEVGTAHPGVTIAKAEYTGKKTENSSARFGTAGSCDLTDVLGNLDGAALGTPGTSGEIFDGALTVSGKVLSYKLKGDAAVGAATEVTVPVSCTNYEDFTVAVTVTVAAKLVPSVTVSPITVTYTGQAVPNSAIQGTAVCNGENVPGQWEFAGTADLVNAGSCNTAIRFVPGDGDTYETVTVENVLVQIAPAPLSERPVFTGGGEGTTLADVTWTFPSGLTGTLTWELPGDTAIGQGVSYRYTFTPGDTNYAEFSDTVILWAKPYTPPPVNPDPPVDPDPGPDEPDPPADPGQVETKTEVEEGISQVPEGLKTIPALDSPAKLEAAMRTSVTQTGIPSQNTAVYDVKLMVSADGGQTWTPATPANFPSGGLTVTLPYPAGTDSSYTFTVVHMFTTTAFGKTPGDTESPAVTNTEAGLRFTVNGLSPISVGWKEKEPDRPVTPGRPSGGGDSGSDVSTYRVTVEQAAHGKVTSNRTYAPEDSTVTLTVTPDSGYTLDTLTVTDSRGNAVTLTEKDSGKYTFTMPSQAVTVTASFAPIAWSNPYTDAAAGAWYYEAVRFVSENGFMGGYGNGLFGPNDTLTRAQFAQILFNKEGRPVVNYLLQYNDVADGAWYTEAVRWAASQGVAGGYGNGMFSPNDNITREQLAVMLWRYAGNPVATDQELRFNDANEISGFALEAMCWAVENGVMGGYGNGQLAPKGLATRAQAAQMLKNFLEK